MRTLQTKECSKCGEVKAVSHFYYHRQRKCYMATCKACNSVSCREYQATKRGELDTRFIFSVRGAGIRRDARHKGVPAMTGLGKHLERLWNTQGGLCWYTHEAMDLTGYGQGNRNAATVDRLLPKLGYVAGNIVLCRSIVNRMKQDMEYCELLQLCRDLLTNEPRVQAAVRRAKNGG